MAERTSFQARTEARPVAEKQLTAEQRRAVKALRKALSALAEHQGPAAAARRQGFVRIAAERRSTVFLLDGPRGTGKSTTMLTLLHQLHEAAAPRLHERDEPTAAPFVLPVRILDLSLIGDHVPVALAMAHALEPVVRALAECDADQPRALLLRDWERITADIARHRLRPGGRPEEDAELVRRQSQQLQLSERVEALVEQIMARAEQRWGSRPLLVAAIDDADTVPDRCHELLIALRDLHHPRLVWLIAGDTEIMLASAARDLAGDLGLPVDHPRVGQLAAQLIERSLPLAHRFAIGRLSAAEALQVEGPDDGLQARLNAALGESSATRFGGSAASPYEVLLPDRLRSAVDLWGALGPAAGDRNRWSSILRAVWTQTLLGRGLALGVRDALARALHWRAGQPEPQPLLVTARWSWQEKGAAELDPEGTPLRRRLVLRTPVQPISVRLFGVDLPEEAAALLLFAQEVLIHAGAPLPVGWAELLPADWVQVQVELRPGQRLGLPWPRPAAVRHLGEALALAADPELARRAADPHALAWRWTTGGWPGGDDVRTIAYYTLKERGEPVLDGIRALHGWHRGTDFVALRPSALPDAAAAALAEAGRAAGLTEAEVRELQLRLIGAGGLSAGPTPLEQLTARLRQVPLRLDPERFGRGRPADLAELVFGAFDPEGNPWEDVPEDWLRGLLAEVAGLQTDAPAETWLRALMRARAIRAPGRAPTAKGAWSHRLAFADLPPGAAPPPLRHLVLIGKAVLDGHGATSRQPPPDLLDSLLTRAAAQLSESLGKPLPRLPGQGTLEKAIGEHWGILVQFLPCPELWTPPAWTAPLDLHLLVRLWNHLGGHLPGSAAEARPLPETLKAWIAGIGQIGLHRSWEKAPDPQFLLEDALTEIWKPPSRTYVGPRWEAWDAWRRGLWRLAEADSPLEEQDKAVVRELLAKDAHAAFRPPAGT
jgi:hypothetical protein